MDMDRAISILGINRTRNCDLAPMATALGLHSCLNTQAENERRAAANYVLRRWRAYQQECNRRRDLKIRYSR
jgi:hypothetical protein